MDNAVDIAMKLIIAHEGWSAKAYKCPAEIWTVGWGRTGKDVNEKSVTTKAAEEVWLRKRIEDEISFVRLKALNPEIGQQLNDNQVAALVSFIYNVGRGNWASSGVRRFLLVGDETKAKAAWARWVRAGGLVLKGLERRRAAEITLFETKS